MRINIRQTCSHVGVTRMVILRLGDKLSRNTSRSRTCFKPPSHQSRAPISHGHRPQISYKHNRERGLKGKGKVRLFWKMDYDATRKVPYGSPLEIHICNFVFVSSAIAGVQDMKV